MEELEGLPAGIVTCQVYCIRAAQSCFGHTRRSQLDGRVRTAKKEEVFPEGEASKPSTAHFNGLEYNLPVIECAVGHQGLVLVCLAEGRVGHVVLARNRELHDDDSLGSFRPYHQVRAKAGSSDDGREDDWVVLVVTLGLAVIGA